MPPAPAAYLPERRGRGQPLQQQQQQQDTIARPGTVKINVEGAFIVDDEENVSVPDPAAEVKYKHETKGIRLPNHTAIVSHIAVDIGGSLAKLVYFSRERDAVDLGGRLNFLKFETDKIDTCIDFMRQLQLKYEQVHNGHHAQHKSQQQLCVMATGGGAFKFYDRIRSRMGVEVLREDEMECLIIGLDFFITEIPNEVFVYIPPDTDQGPSASANAGYANTEHNPIQFTHPSADDPAAIYPYLLVNIGSGVSMIKVSGPRNFQRIGGTSLGGGTLWGLLSLLTGARTFDDMLALADKGDNAAVDMLVGDIYGTGTGYSKIGLKSSTIASSFGKVFKMKREAERQAEDGSNLTNGEVLDVISDPAKVLTGEEPPVAGDGRMFKPQDVSRSLLYAVSNNIGQIAYLQSEKHKLKHIYFGGSFIQGHRQTMNTLSYAIKFWSQGEKQAYFLRHEGYLGAVGAFLKRVPPNFGRRNSLDALDRYFAGGPGGLERTSTR